MRLPRKNPATPSGEPSAGPLGDPADGSGERVLERFKPTTGLIPGYAGLAIALFTIAYVVLNVHTVTGLRIALAAVFAGVVVWVSQLRPRATAYTSFLELRGALRDAHVPYVLIDDVRMGQTLNVYADDRRFVCIGIGKSLGSDLKQRAKKERQGSMLGRGRYREFADRAERAAPDQTAMSYHTFVVTRIEEIVALVVSGLAFVVSLFV
jgi:hypothetical protein